MKPHLVFVVKVKLYVSFQRKITCVCGPRYFDRPFPLAFRVNLQHTYVCICDNAQYMSMSYNFYHETKSSEYRDTISNSQCKCSLRPKCIIEIHETHLLEKTQMISVNKPLYWRKRDIAPRWAPRESNLMFKLSSDKDKNSFSLSVYEPLVSMNTDE